MDASYEKFIAGLEFSPSEDAILEWRDEEAEMTEENIGKYIEIRIEKIERLISKLPGKSRSALLEVSAGARDIAERLKKYKLALGRVYYTPEHAILYGASREAMGKAYDELIERFRYVSQVALGIISTRTGRNGNMLPLDKSKWLERGDL